MSQTVWVRSLMNSIVASAIVAAMIACSGATQQAQANQKISELQRQIADLNAKLAEKSKASTIDAQEKCAERARKDFTDWGFIAKEEPDFTSHYNEKLDRCFVQFQNTLENGEWFWRELFDAYGGQQYGQFGDETKPDEGTKIVECDVKLPSGEDRTCNSDDEFMDLVKVYMGS